MIEDWEDFADWWDKKQGDEGDLWHRTLIDPAVLRVLGNVSSKDILDLGCGNGYFSRRLSRMGAHVTGIDCSKSIVERAREREALSPLGITYHVADASGLSMLASSSFDIALANMTLDDMKDADGAIRECARVLRDRGRFVASISHPCFDMGKQTSWLVERVGLDTQVYRKVGSNYRNTFEDLVEWRIDEGERMQTKWYHRPLSWYVRTLRNAGFVVTALEEPEPQGEFLQQTNQPWIQMIPVHCVFEAVRLDV